VRRHQPTAARFFLLAQFMRLSQKADLLARLYRLWLQRAA
jgi:hypothetical protein